ncbi:MAG: phage tail sheath subtilisin-like domain-containing protein [Desulfobulbaceae bacterium]|nr:phage tail sheath subtilisin-like domain-containing protein [Desulfobulbaceae bacterium]
MPISFDSIPSQLRVPLAYVEFNNERAVSGTPGIMHKILVIGQRLAAGEQAAEVPFRVNSPGHAEAAAGRGSMFSHMINALKLNNRFTETWGILLDDDVAGVAAAGNILFGGAVTAAGTLNLYIAGNRVRVAIAAAQTLSSIATAVVAAINADTSLPVTAAVNGGVPEQVDITARWKGETGNGIDLRVNYYQDEKTPTGLTTTVTAMTGGTGNPDIADAVAVLGDEWWNHIVMPYTDSANLTALETELTDRWGPTRQIDGIAYAAYRGTQAATQTFGDGRNSLLVTCMGTGISPTPPYVWAAAVAAEAAHSLAIDPARPLQTLVLDGVLPPAIEDRWTMEERNLLLYDGIATHTVDSGGRVLIERLITMYQENAYGVADPSYLDVNTPATLSYLRYSTRARITQKFPRHKLADDGTNYGAGQKIVTPKVIRNELIALFKEWELAGLVENIDQYKADLVVERDVNDRNRVNVLAPPDLVNQFRVFAEQMQFIV